MLVNSERERGGLLPFHFSVDLAALARRHSADMAFRGTLSHLSSSGLSYQERLVRSDFFFAHGGENVARSETPVADIIHRSLMESSEHRQNILAPEFDTIGIGVARIKDGDYFITQDYIQAIEPLSIEEAKAGIADKIQRWRSARSFPPLIFLGEAGRLAQEFAEARAAQAATPPLPVSRREMHIFIVATASLEKLDEKFLHIDNPSYEEGGLGVAFGRLKDNPGGAYCVALALYPKNVYLSMAEEERGEVIRTAINRMRQNSGLKSLEADESLAKEAARIALRVANGDRSGLDISSGSRRRTVFSFQSGNLEQIPRQIEETVCAPHFVRIGLRALFIEDKERSQSEFLVVGVIE